MEGALVSPRRGWYAYAEPRMRFAHVHDSFHPPHRRAGISSPPRGGAAGGAASWAGYRIRRDSAGHRRAHCRATPHLPLRLAHRYQPRLAPGRGMVFPVAVGCSRRAAALPLPGALARPAHPAGDHRAHPPRPGRGRLRRAGARPARYPLSGHHLGVFVSVSPVLLWLAAHGVGGGAGARGHPVGARAGYRPRKAGFFIPFHRPTHSAAAYRAAAP
ncbi:MAG: hypothetical protein BWY76_03192 [bacterium ADurb.Bin429]|nr:MAG: hypothetical protein BWY76_03192 [bacterium ADurb.Bin429]